MATRRRSRKIAAAPAPASRAKGTAAKPAAPDPLVGKVLGRCKLLERIGQGRTAAVYRAQHQALDSTVAVKVLLPSVAQHPEIVERFETEARAIARIDNENVLKIYDVGAEEGRHFIVMELLDGESILDVIEREERIDPMDALRIVRQVAQGLGAAHARKIIHRDVKPQNMVLLEDGTVKLVDFGLAVGDEAGSQRVGTPHYMAPEVCSTGLAVTQSDIYALGISLYHMLVGRPPYAGQDIPSILRSHTKGEALAPEWQVPGLSREIADLVRTLTKREALVRPSAPDVIELLDGIGGKELKAKDSLRARSRRRRMRTRTKTPAVALFAGIGFLALIGIVIAATSSSKGDGPARPGGDTASVPRPVSPTPALPTTPATPAPAPIPTVSPAEQAAIDAKNREEKRRIESLAALQEVERWIRENWHGQADTGAVVARYQSMRDAWKETEAAKEADTRAKEIKAGRRHPHPDKTWADADVVAQTLESWRSTQAEVETLMGAHRYLDAKEILPPVVEDPTGKLARDLGFWHPLLDRLLSFKTALSEEESKLPEADRRLTTPDGEVTLREATEKELIVEQKGVKKLIPWDSVPDVEIWRLARKAFAEKGVERQVDLAAFAFAHRLRDEFFESVLEAELAPGVGPFTPLLNAWKGRLDEWMAAAPARGK